MKVLILLPLFLTISCAGYGKKEYCHDHNLKAEKCDKSWWKYKQKRDQRQREHMDRMIDRGHHRR